MLDNRLSACAKQRKRLSARLISLVFLKCKKMNGCKKIEQKQIQSQRFSPLVGPHFESGFKATVSWSSADQRAVFRLGGLLRS